MRSEPATALPSTWSGSELKIVSGRVAKTRADLRSIRSFTPTVDAWLEAAALCEETMPLRTARETEPPVVGKREAFSTQARGLFRGKRGARTA
jgi:hypothetical protein